MAKDQKVRLEITDGTPAGGKHRKRGEFYTADILEANLLISCGKAKLAPLEEEQKPVEQEAAGSVEDKSSCADDTDPLGDNADAPLANDPEALKEETRDELFARAVALGLKPQKNTGEKKLRAMIEAATPTKGE